jgi:hypothetical protein
MENQNQGTAPNSEQFNQQFGFTGGTQNLPNATAVLVLGIISIVGCFCYGIVGLITGIIALVLASKDNALLAQNPGVYKEGSIKNLRAGKICAIIGTSLSGIYLVVIIVAVLFWGALLTQLPWGDMMKAH